MALDPSQFCRIVNIAVNGVKEDLEYAFTSSEQLDECDGVMSVQELIPNSRTIFPLNLRMANAYIGDRIVLVG